MDTKWQPVIGLEIHAQLLTKSKLFSSDSASFFKQENTSIHPVSLGMPGTLPVLNQTALEYAIRTGIAFNCHINKKSVFARKHYFYPDLPKAYQISQYDKPLCEKGSVEFICQGEKHEVRIHRIHVEEDAGRFRHQAEKSLVNFNRAGVPLVEIVSEPDLSSPEAAASMVRMIRNILKYIGVCDGSLEEGSLRCDCNVSVKEVSKDKLGTRTELKNINSFKFIEKAIHYEIKRQINILKTGGVITRETRLYNSIKNQTFPLRSKEESSDYRYFPDPDLLPIVISDSWIQKQKKYIPELPLIKLLRFKKEYHISEEEAALLVEDPDLAKYFENLFCASCGSKLAVNWLINEVLAKLNKNKQHISKASVSPDMLGDLVNKIDQNVVSGKMAKKIFDTMWSHKLNSDQVIQKWNLKQISSEADLTEIIQKIISKFPKQLMAYKSGKLKIFDFFVGQVMRETRGQAEPEKLKQILKKKLD